VPGHDSASWAALRFTLVDHGAARSQSIAGVNSAMECELIDAEEKSARFAEIFHREAEYGEKNQHRINHYPRMSVSTRIRPIEVKRIETQRQGGEERVLAFVQRTPPMMGKNLAYFEIVVQVTLRDFAGARAPVFTYRHPRMPLHHSMVDKLCQSQRLVRKGFVQSSERRLRPMNGLAGSRPCASCNREAVVMRVRSVLVTILVATALSVTGVRGYAFSLSQLLGGGDEQDLNTFKLIHVADLKALLTQRGDKIHVYDANGDMTREKFGTIPGATLLASDDDYPLSVLPANKQAALVFYCADRH
jgi:hypothetical protein